MLQVHLYYSGRVQGVGFRYSASDFAKSLKITGWVKNLPDGRVEIIAQGEETALYKFLDKFKEIFGNYISKVDTDWQSIIDRFDDFQITF